MKMKGTCDARRLASALYLAVAASGIARTQAYDYQAIFDSLKQFEEAFPLAIQADPVYAGRMSGRAYADGRHYAVFRPLGNDPGDISTSVGGVTQPPTATVTINGRNATIYLDEDRELPAGYYHLTAEITLVKAGDRVLFEKKQAWDHWPQAGLKQYGNTLRTFFEVKEADLVEGTINGDYRRTTPSVRCSPARFRVRILRDPNVGAAGAFTVKVLPLGIHYPPPPGAQGRNTLQYGESAQVGTAIRASVKQENSETVPATPFYCEYLGGLKSALGGLSKAASLVPLAGTYLSSALNALSSGMGSATASDQTGSMRTEDGALLTEQTTSSTFTTTPGARPGLDDEILLVTDARFAWLSFGGAGLTLYPLGAVGFKHPSVADLQADLAVLEKSAPPPTTPPPADTGAVGDLEFGPQNQPSAPPSGPAARKAPVRKTTPALQPGVRPPRGPLPDVAGATLGPKTGLDLETIRGLLALDPLAANPRATLQPPRFVKVPITPAGGIPVDEPDAWNGDYTLTHAVVAENTVGTAKWQTHIEKYSRGWLFWLGFGPSETKETRVVTTYSSERKSLVGRTITTKLTMVVGPDEPPLTIRAYYDTAFGVFLVQEVEQDATPRCAGIARDAAGKPIANQWITLQAGGRTYATRTDASGAYRFRSATIPAGRAVLKFGAGKAASKPVTLPPRTR